MSAKRIISDFFKSKPSVHSANLLEISETVDAGANECESDNIVEDSNIYPKRRKVQEDDPVQDDDSPLLSGDENDSSKSDT